MIVTTRPLCLSPRRMAVLVALYRLSRPTPWGLGYSPTIREIMQHTGISSTAVVHYQLELLARPGLVNWPGLGLGGVTAGRSWRPNYDRLQFITVAGVTTVSERA